jgi:HEAT repeat protein
MAAIQALVEIRHSESPRYLVKALSDPHLPIAHEALDRLAELGSDALPALIAAVETPESEAAISPLDAIDRIDPQTARNIARDLLSRTSIPGGTRAPVSVLAHTANPDDASFLIDALGDQDLLTMKTAITGLGHMRAAKAIPALVTLLDHPDEWLAAKAARALGEIGDKSAGSELASRISIDTPHHLAMACADALVSLDATEYAGKLIDEMLSFAKKGLGLGDAPIRLAGRTEIKRVVAALSDPESVVAAVNFLCALVRWRDFGVELARNAGAVEALIDALSTADRDRVYPPAIIVVIEIVGRDRAVELIREAAGRSELDHASEEYAISIVEKWGR